jgi:hypothetical protein
MRAEVCLRRKDPMQNANSKFSSNRRQFVATALLSTCGILPSFAVASEYDKYFGRDWRVPAHSTLDIWPSRIGLDLSGTLAAIADWSVPVTSRLVIRLADGEHLQKGRIVVRHSAGERLSIIGNTRAPDRCRLVWTNVEDAFYAGAAALLGWIDGVLVEHVAPEKRGIGSAFLADEGGVIRCGPKVIVKGFYYGFQARRNGVIRCAETESRGAGDANYFAFLGGHIFAPNARAVAARDDANKLGSGFVAEYGGSIDAEGATAEFNALAGFTALSNGVIRAYKTTARHNGRAGFYTRTGGMINAHNAVAHANCGDGILSQGDGVSGNDIRTNGNFAPLESCIIK